MVSPLWRFAPFHDSGGKSFSPSAIVRGKPIPRRRMETTRCTGVSVRLYRSRGRVGIRRMTENRTFIIFAASSARRIDEGCERARYCRALISPRLCAKAFLALLRLLLAIKVAAASSSRANRIGNVDTLYYRAIRMR